jgi:hypothetical protein
MVIGKLIHRVLIEAGTLSEHEVEALVAMILHGVSPAPASGGARQAAPRGRRSAGRTPAG